MKSEVNKKDLLREGEDLPLEQEQEQSEKNTGTIFHTIFYALAAAFIVSLVFDYILLSGYVGTSSMNDTIATHSYTVGIRLNKTYKRNDVVTFASPDDYYGDDFVKRIVADEGDVFFFDEESKKLYVNGKEEGDYVKGETLPLENFEYNKEYKVPEGKVLLLGDNREESYDARSWVNPYYDKEYIRSKMKINYRFDISPGRDGKREFWIKGIK